MPEVSVCPGSTPIETNSISSSGTVIEQPIRLEELCVLFLDDQPFEFLQGQLTPFPGFLEMRHVAGREVLLVVPGGRMGHEHAWSLEQFLDPRFRLRGRGGEDARVRPDAGA